MFEKLHILNKMMNEENIDACSTSSSETIPIGASEIKENLRILTKEEKRLIMEEKRLKNRLEIEEKKILQKKLSEEENQIRKKKATKSMNYLLENSKKYSSIFEHILQNNNNNNISKSPYKKKSNIQPKNFKGTLYPYQLEGLSWLKVLFENKVSGILADEMGLGKTIQVIALICYLMEMKIKGPYLIVAPLSTIPNWISEFKKFAPKIPVVLFYGNATERENTYEKIHKTYSIDGFLTRPVVITSYQMPLNEGKFLANYRWQYLIIDEGQRIKNYECRLFHELQKLTSINRLLLTGTPLQNDLCELWTLFHFIMPQIFEHMDTFGDLFQLEDFNESNKILKQERETKIISTIHGVLNPFMIRRLKSDVLNIVPKKEILVYCPLSELQNDLYRYVLQKNMAKLTGKDEEEKEEEEKENLSELRRTKRKCVKKTSYLLPSDFKDDDFMDVSLEEPICDLKIEMPNADKRAIHRCIKMQNPTMILRKIINHPFAIHCPVVANTREVIVSEDIVTQSGKMMVLDALLTRLKKGGHKVLLFCTLTSVLDFIEDYLIIRNYSYCRLDGKCNINARQKDIHEFNTNPDKFIFIISTRAGGLGINLTAADTVIFFDRDWNPQTDLQAQDRCHRIGQTKPVVIYSLFSKGTLDEYIFSRATAKRRLEKIVIQKNGFMSIKKPDNMIKSCSDLKELEDLLNSVDHKQVIQANGFVLSDEELSKLMDRSDLYKEWELQNEHQI